MLSSCHFSLREWHALCESNVAMEHHNVDKKITAWLWTFWLRCFFANEKPTLRQRTQGKMRIFEKECHLPDSSSWASMIHVFQRMWGCDTSTFLSPYCNINVHCWDNSHMMALSSSPLCCLYTYNGWPYSPSVNIVVSMFCRENQEATTNND